MRKSRVVGFAIAGILAVGTIAQAQSTTTQPQQQRRAMRREGNGGRGRLFQGITLSDAEKSRVKAIRAKYGTEARALRESMRPAMQEMQAARQKRDTAAIRAAWDRTTSERQNLQALMQRERAEMRTALTVENQQVFDANVKSLEQRRAERKKAGRGDRVGKAKARGRRGVSQS